MQERINSLPPIFVAHMMGYRIEKSAPGVTEMRKNLNGGRVSVGEVIEYEGVQLSNYEFMLKEGLPELCLKMYARELG